MSSALILKMGRERDATRRRQLRKNRQNEKRQNCLITDYVQHKYANVYAEAFHFYKRLNDRHPNKTDLRKTDEYRLWKSGVSCMSPQNHVQEQEPPNPANSEPQEPSHVSSESQSSSPANCEPPSPATTESQAPGNHIYEDNLQLKIPIQRYRTVKHNQSTTTQTLSIVSEESAQEPPATVQMPHVEALQPTLFDELPADLVDQIIGQLSEDPDLKNMFDNIDEPHIFEEMDFEISESTLLEKELENW